MMWILLACNVSPYPDYWPDPHKSPVIGTISPESVDGMAGGQTITIKGEKLQDVQTVLFGDRNATVLSTSQTELQIEAPAFIGGGGAIDVTIVGKNGYHRKQQAFQYVDAAAGWWQDETTSIAVVALDCPAEIYAFDLYDYDPYYDWFPIFWCGLELGDLYATGLQSGQGQAGVAGDMSYLTPLSWLASADEPRFWFFGEERTELPIRYSTLTVGESIKLQKNRDFYTDVEFIEARKNLFLQNYSWSDYITESNVIVRTFDSVDQELNTRPITSGDLSAQQISSVDDGAVSQFWLGFDILEYYSDTESYQFNGFLISGDATLSAGQMESSTAGFRLDYDDYSGNLWPLGKAGLLGRGDLQGQQLYDVIRHTNDKDEYLGQVHSGDDFDLVAPDVMSGEVQVLQSEDLLISWNPLTRSDDPMVVVAELRVYDLDVDDPNGWFEVARLVKHSADDSGEMILLAEELSALPIANNYADEYGDLVSLWGELTISRHQFRKINYNDEVVVIDFVRSVQSLVDLVP